ncbi:MAG: hypothetical protein LQ349_002637, partial [Xanthoria aureola]
QPPTKASQPQPPRNELNDLYPKAQTLCIQLCTQHHEHPEDTCHQWEQLYATEKAPYMRALGQRPSVGKFDLDDVDLRGHVSWDSLVFVLVVLVLGYLALVVLQRYVEELRRRWRRMERRGRWEWM